MNQYSITYAGGVKQVKNLISHDDDYLKIIKPALHEAYLLECKATDDSKKAAKKIKSGIKRQFGEWFTDKSPLFESIKTGIVSLLSHQGGNHIVTIEQLNP